MPSQSKLWGVPLHLYKAAAEGLSVLGLSRQRASLASCSLEAL